MRKVTDLLPSEAILISCGAERNTVLDLMDNAGFVWNSGERANYVFIRNKFPYALAYKFNGNDGFPNRGIRIVDLDYDGDVTFYPATDFIPTESDEVDKFDLSKLTRYDLEYCSGDDGVCTAEMVKSDDGDGDYVLWSDIELFLKTRNTPNQ